MSKSATFTAAQRHALDLMVGQWAVLGHTRPSEIHAGTLRALIGHGYVDGDGRTITAAGFRALDCWGPEIDALGPTLDRARLEADRVRGIRAELRVAMDREAQAERLAAVAAEAVRAMLRARREGRDG